MALEVEFLGPTREQTGRKLNLLEAPCPRMHCSRVKDVVLSHEVCANHCIRGNPTIDHGEFVAIERKPTISTCCTNFGTRNGRIGVDLSHGPELSLAVVR